MSLFKNLGKTVKTVQIPAHTVDLPGYLRMPGFIRDYIDHLASKNFSKATMRRYVYDFDSFFSFVAAASGQDVRAIDITQEAFLEIDGAGIAAYAEYLALTKGNAPSVINRKLSALQSLFRHLIDIGVLSENPVAKINRPKQAKRDPVYLTKREWDELIQLLPSNIEMNPREAAHYERDRVRDVTLFQLLGYSGMRLSEMTQLTWNDLDFHEGTIRVIGKGNKERVIPLAQPARIALRKYAAHYQLSMRGTEAVFEKQGKPLSPRAVQHILKRHTDRLRPVLPFLERKHITPHKLRHTFATRLATGGVDVLTIQQLLGHESVATTQVYAHIGDQEKKRAIELFDGER
ncbi:tyrosine-type recombinase/integrase [Exiguobacterium sp. s193]|uniref:tyrosine-type recombinase/integrase n=1 Tax=Exiguobacterium sp. s193 TaxID=2751207 RepID=UPI0020368936|nr:tyrosine-type recombinase/integrase [Exiguobacterium sp. s193]